MLYLELVSCSASSVHSDAGNFGFLSEGEACRAASFTSIRRRSQFLAGRMLARRMLCRVFGGNPEDWSIRAEDGFPPVIEDFHEGRLSISHSGDWVVCALSDQEVGVDVELIKPQRDVMGIAQMVCHPREIGMLEQLNEAGRLERFTQFWCLKEAWLKRQGGGLDPVRMRKICAEPSNPVEMQAITLQCADSSGRGMLAIVSPEALTVQIDGKGALHTGSLSLWHFAV